MKLNDRMRYPHPVLSEYSSDFVSGEFECSFEQNVAPDKELRIKAELRLTNADLLSLIETQKAASGYFVICRPTYFNRLQKAPLGTSERFFDATKLYGTVILRPVVWTMSTLENFYSPLVDREFGSTLRIPKGSVIALGPEFRFSMDRKRYKPFDSIFQLDQDSTVPPGTVAVDPEGDRISISAEPQTYASIAAMRGMPAGRSILLNAVYMPAIMDVIARLQTGENALEGKKWYRVFRAKCDEIGVVPNDSGRSTLEIAQKLLREPLKKAIAIAESL